MLNQIPGYRAISLISIAFYDCRRFPVRNFQLFDCLRKYLHQVTTLHLISIVLYTRCCTWQGPLILLDIIILHSYSVMTLSMHIYTTLLWVAMFVSYTHHCEPINIKFTSSTFLHSMIIIMSYKCEMSNIILYIHEHNTYQTYNPTQTYISLCTIIYSEPSV